MKKYLFFGLVFLLAITLFNSLEGVKVPILFTEKSESNGPVAREIQVDEGIIPNLIGFDAYDAFSKVTELGFRVAPYSLAGEYIYEGGASYEEVFSGNFICYQAKLPGSVIGELNELRLVMDPSCEGKVTRMLAGPYAEEADTWTPQVLTGATAFENESVQGWVVGYGDEYSPELVTILTTYGELTVGLGFIEPISNWCRQEAFPGDNQDLLALHSVQEMLPLFSPVSALFGDTNQFDLAFMHRLDSEGNLTDGKEPVNSVNELLVKTGYWIPEALGLQESSFDVDPLKKKWFISSTDFHSEFELPYLRRLVAAGNALRFTKTNPIGICVVAEKTYWDETYADYVNQEVDSGGSSGGGGSNGGCYVRGHYRGGTWVNGYYRNC